MYFEGTKALEWNKDSCIMWIIITFDYKKQVTIFGLLF